jgi:HlyD family secretion protein
VRTSSFLKRYACGAAAGLIALVVPVPPPRELLHGLPGSGQLEAHQRGDLSGLLFASIQRGVVEQTVTATGAIQPVDTVEVGSQLPGQIARLWVDFNDKVHVGDPLAELDRRTFQAKVDEVRAALEMSKTDVRIQQAMLERARIDLLNSHETRTALSAKLESAKALKEAAERNTARKTLLKSRDIASATMVEDAESDLASKRALLQEAATALTLNRNLMDAAAADVRRLESEFTKAKAAVPLREAILRAAEADLDRTIIRSPMNGIIVGRLVNMGQTLAAGLEVRPMFIVAHDLADMEIHARVDETDIGKIAIGQHATFTVDAHPNRSFSANVRQIRQAPQVNQNVVTYVVVLSTANPDGILMPGMTATVRLVVHRENDVLKVPLAALRFRPKPNGSFQPAAGTTVWVRTAAGGIKPVPVTTGPLSGDQGVLTSGALSEGDQVVIGQTAPSGAQRLFGIDFGS